MSISFFLLLVCACSLFAVNTNAQNVKIEITSNNLSVRQLITEIEKQTEYLVLFRNNDVDVDRVVTVENSSGQVASYLDAAFKDTDIHYEFQNKYILLAKSTESAKALFAQPGRTITGVITDTDGETIIGANVLVKGTSNGVISDINGSFTIIAEPGSTLLVSYIGYITQEVKLAANQHSLNIVLTSDNLRLDEVVVIGYGVQKKKLVTGATVQIKGDDLTKLNTNNPLSAMQSQTPGVNIIQSNGQPGEEFKVTIRGLGTIGNSSPLYVIDGVAGGDINALNPSDIESIDVLKDAASAAIYGSRAANGVVLITTKQGRQGKMTFSYDNYIGKQYLGKKPGLLNAQEYMEVQDIRLLNDGYESGYDWESLLPSALYNAVRNGSWKGTNWLDEAYNKGAITQNHAINMTGGNDLSKFSLGFSYSQQEGILGWNKIDPVHADYVRYTVRVNSDHVLRKSGNREVIKIGETLNFTYSTNNGIQQGNIYSNDLHNYLVAIPLLPCYTYDENGKITGWYDQAAKVSEGWLLDNKEANPLALSALSSRGKNESVRFVLQASAYLQIEPIKDLVFKSQYGFKYTSSTSRRYTNEYYLSGQREQPYDEVSQSASSGYNWTLDNTISYKFTINSDHAFSAVLGQSAEKWGFGRSVGSGSQNTIYSGAGFDYAWVSNGKPTELTQVSYSGSPWGKGAIASFFGRVNYNYNEKYLASVVLRADGSSNFARGNRWGYFPSASAGWVISEEGFFEDVKAVDFLKLRASWGQNGNCSIDNYQYLTSFSFSDSNGYAFDPGKNIMATGAIANVLANPNVSWETSEQINIGIDSRFLNSRLGVVADWYVKKTKDWLVRAPIAGVYGFNPPYINGGDVKNSGIELGLNWNDKKGSFRYGASFNFTYNKNEVTRIANDEGIIHGPSKVLSESTGEYYRVEVGRPIGFFYGYKTAGVFQNQAQIDATPVKLNSAQPGDLIFVDTNKDGKIDEDDRTMIGNPHPDVMIGFNLNMQYKGFDFSLTGRGSFGHEIAKSYRSFADSPQNNYTKEVFDTWKGEGTSNKWPRLTSGSHTNWSMLSDIYLEKGDFVKISNITLGYDFAKLLDFSKFNFSKVRLYVSANNLITFTGYSGMDPEIGYGFTDSSWMSGIDLGSYPSSKTYMLGVNIHF